MTETGVSDTFRFMHSKTALERFLFRTKKGPSASHCWEWTGSKYGQGYGHISVNGKNTMAHRFSYQIFVGPIPDGMVICHKCDRPSCVNPNHLFLGTQAQNLADMDAKGRRVNNNQIPRRPSGPIASRVKALRKRREEAGLIRIDVWVLKEDAEEIRKYAAELLKQPMESRN